MLVGAIVGVAAGGAAFLALVEPLVGTVVNRKKARRHHRGQHHLKRCQTHLLYDSVRSACLLRCGTNLCFHDDLIDACSNCSTCFVCRVS